MPRKVSGTPSRPHRKPKKRVPTRVASPASPIATPVRAAPSERPRAEAPLRSAAGRARAAAAPVVDYHYVVEDLKRVGIIALGMFAVLGILAVFLR